MIQVSMFEAKTELSKPAKLLESGQEDVVYIVRNNSPVAQMTLIDPSRKTKRIGAAEGRFTIPDNFDTWDDEIEELFDARIGEYDTPCVLKV